MDKELTDYIKQEVSVAANTATNRLDYTRLVEQGDTTNEQVVDEPTSDVVDNPLPKPYVQDLYQRGPDVWTPEVANDYYTAKRTASEAWWLTDDVPAAFWHGGNIAVDVGKEFHRKMTAGQSDPNWNDAAITQWLDNQETAITPAQRSYFYGTTNMQEASMLLADINADVQAQKVQALRGGFKTFTANAVAGLIDVDTPLAMLSGGITKAAKLGINATRAGR